jgi:hypothetical protein
MDISWFLNAPREAIRPRPPNGRLYLVRLFYKLYFWVIGYIFRYKLQKWRLYRKRLPRRQRPLRSLRLPRFFREPLSYHPRAALGRSGSDRRAFYRVTDADLANLANLRLRAEAQYSSALLHSPRPLLMTQVSPSEVKCGRPPSPLQQKLAAACISDLIRDRRVGAAK